MVIHVTVCTIQSRILSCPSIKIKNLLDPLPVWLLLLRLKMVNFWNWAILRMIVRLEVVIAGIEIANVSPMEDGAIVGCGGAALVTGGAGAPV